jgi:hypothetical protein
MQVGQPLLWVWTQPVHINACSAGRRPTGSVTEIFVRIIYRECGECYVNTECFVSCKMVDFIKTHYWSVIFRTGCGLPN